VFRALAILLALAVAACSSISRAGSAPSRLAHTSLRVAGFVKASGIT
jgi:hypothetical protein